jgi:hypothetical protein
MTDHALRQHLLGALDWSDAHVSFDQAVEGVPETARGVRPAGLPHSLWELLEHIRLTQRDILDFCRDPEYREREWPRDYWPRGPEPPATTDWERSVEGFRSDREALRRLLEGDGMDLLAGVPQGTGQTYLRELLLVLDHTAYHVGQIVLTRHLLNIWPGR